MSVMSKLGTKAKHLFTLLKNSEKSSQCKCDIGWKLTNLKNCKKGHQFLRQVWCSLHDLLCCYVNHSWWRHQNAASQMEPRGTCGTQEHPIIMMHKYWHHWSATCACSAWRLSAFQRHIKMYSDGGKANFICRSSWWREKKDGFSWEGAQAVLGEQRELKGQCQC